MARPYSGRVATPDPVSLHLVRHGQSTWNAAGRLQGQTPHPPLTALGRDQAYAAATELTRLLPPDTDAELVSSDLVRARQTAQIIAAALGRPLRWDPALREQGLGTMEGALTSTLTALPTPDGTHLSEVRWGGGESLADVAHRLRDWCRCTLADSPRHLVVVSHGDTIRVLLAVLRGGGHRDVDWGEVVGNGSVTSVELTGADRARLVVGSRWTATRR